MFDENRELSDPPIDSKDPNTIKAQKRSKDIIKVIHLALVVPLKFYKATRILFVRKEKKNNDFIQQFVFSASPYSAILESITYINKHVHMCSCGSVVEHCVSSAKVVGSNPREHTYWQKNCITRVSRFG